MSEPDNRHLWWARYSAMLAERKREGLPQEHDFPDQDLLTLSPKDIRFMHVAALKVETDPSKALIHATLIRLIDVLLIPKKKAVAP